MATIGAISAALKLVAVKKENLRKAFEELQSQSSSLSASSSFTLTLTWSDLDSYISSLQSSLHHKFNLLQSLDLHHHVPARPELKSFCEKMDGLGLWQYVIDQRADRAAIKDELHDAYKCAPDPAAIVLDAMEGFYNVGNKGKELSSLRSACVVLLEELFGLKPAIAVELREKAMKLAVEWKEKIVGGLVVEGEKPLETLGFLLLVATYGLVDGFNMDELIHCITIVAKRRQAVDLCKAIISAHRISDLIQKLISEGKQVQAVKFSIEFEKTDKFPPVTLLKEYRIESKKLAKKVRKKNNLQSHNESISKELSALRSIIKCIEEYHLESEYPKTPLVNLADKLENDKSSKKRPAAAAPPASNRQQLSRPQKPKAIKHPRTAAPAGPTMMLRSNSNVPLQQPHLQAAGLLPDHHAQYTSSPARSYGVGVPGATPAVPYAGSTASPYGLTRAQLGFTGNPNPTGSNMYIAESHAPPGYYDRPISYGGYDLPPQYHPSYYPQ